MPSLELVEREGWIISIDDYDLKHGIDICPFCGKKILTAVDALYCRDYGKLLHKACDKKRKCPYCNVNNPEHEHFNILEIKWKK